MERRDRGQVLVLVALAIFALLGIAALAVDVGYMYSTRHELQRSADAGALAGASAFTTGDWSDTSMASDHPRGIADARARDFASRDVVVESRLDPAAEVAVAFPAADRIEVVTSRTVPLFFARIFGMDSRLITARAVAQAAVAGPPNDVNCIKPFAIPYPWADDPAYGTDRQGNADGLYEGQPAPGETVYTDCSGGVGLCPGTRITLKVGSPSTDNTSPSGQQSSGQFFLIQGNVGGETFQGAADLRTFISDGCFPIDLTLPVDMMTGNMMGPTVQGIAALIAKDPASQWVDADGAPSSPDHPYDPVNGTHLASERIVRVVIYDPRDPIVGGGSGGTQGTNASIPVGYTLAGFWIEGVGRQGNDGYVTGRYIPASAFGGQSSTNPGPLTGTEVKTISLVE